MPWNKHQRLSPRPFFATRSLAIIFFSALALTAGTATFSQTPLTAFGDSITAGFGDRSVNCDVPSTHAGYPPRLQALLADRGLAVDIQISGVCGEFSEAGVTRLDSVLPTIPVVSSTRGIVILMSGTNDFENGVGIETVLFNLRAMARKVERVNAIPMYSSVLPRITPAGTADNILEEELARRLQGIAAQEGIQFANPFTFFSSVPGIFGSHYFDRIHPNVIGYDLLAEAFEIPTVRALDDVRALRNGTGSFCTNEGPCRAGEGDCDGDAECETGLVCTNDAGARFGFDARIDICLLPDGTVGGGETCPAVLGNGDFCTACGPCAEGEGDCDSDAECGAGLVCTNDAGARFGFSANIDVCLRPGTGDGGGGDGGCSATLGSGTFCSACGVCAEGEGDCDSDDECMPGLVCTDNVGAQFGFNPNIDVCLPTGGGGGGDGGGGDGGGGDGGGDGGGGGCTATLGSGTFCSVCGVCAEGEGDCDSDDECMPGLVCTDNVGAQFGFNPTIDVCLPSDGGGGGGCTATLGSGTFCSACGPCADGEGDCDSDAECQPGLTCTDNVGAQFGFNPNIDVCLSSDGGGGGTCTLTNGRGAFCTECGPCADGEGDCDSDAECAPGLVCVDNVGPQFGFGPNVDVCLAPPS